MAQILLKTIILHTFGVQVEVKQGFRAEGGCRAWGFKG